MTAEELVLYLVELVLAVLVSVAEDLDSVILAALESFDSQAEPVSLVGESLDVDGSEEVFVVFD